MIKRILVNYQNSNFALVLSKYLYQFKKPIYASLLEDRKMGSAILFAVLLHAVLVVLRLPSWSCPIREILGLPCPGCGISRSIIALLHGDLETSISIHAFGPFFLFAIGVLGIVNLLPSHQRHPFICLVNNAERKTGFGGVFLICLVLYWLSRLLFFRNTYFVLVMS